MRWLLFVDPPDHTRLRGLVQRAFTPNKIKAYEPRLRAIADQLLAKIAHQRSPDVVHAFTLPLPVYAIGELLGLPPERWAWLKAASDDITGLIDPLHGFDPSIVNARVTELNAYFSEVVEQRRAEPRDDLISVLVSAADDGERLDTQELLAMLGFLLFAGHETTGHGIHHCLGASLARLELRVAIPAFLDAFGDYTLNPTTTEWKRSLSVRGPTVLPITRGS